MLIFPNAKKKFEICCGIEAFGVPLWRKLLLQTFIQKKVFTVKFTKITSKLCYYRRMRTASNLRLTLICFFLNVFWCGHSKSDASTINAKRGTFDEEKVNYYKWSYEKLTRAHIYILVLQVCTISLISEKCLYFFFSCPIVFNPLHGFTYGGQKFEAFFFVPQKNPASMKRKPNAMMTQHFQQMNFWPTLGSLGFCFVQIIHYDIIIKCERCNFTCNFALIISLGKIFWQYVLGFSW